MAGERAKRYTSRADAIVEQMIQERIDAAAAPLEDQIDELNDALCGLLHRGSEPGLHTPEAHLKLYYRKGKRDGG